MSTMSEGAGMVHRGLEALVGDAATVRVPRLPMLDIVVDRLARLLQSSIRQFTGETADVKIGRVRPVRMGDFLGDLPNPSLIGVLRADQWDGFCLVVADERMIGSLIDIKFGGRRSAHAEFARSQFTQIERRMAQLLVQQHVCPDLKAAFEVVAEVDFALDRTETTPQYAAITKASSAALAFKAEVLMEGRGGTLEFLFPYAIFDSVREALSADIMGKRQGSDAVWRRHVAEEAPQATTELVAVLVDSFIPYGEVMRWKVGSKVSLGRRTNDPVELLSGGLPVLRGRMAASDGDEIALRVDEVLISPEGWPPV